MRRRHSVLWAWSGDADGHLDVLRRCRMSEVKALDGTEATVRIAWVGNRLRHSSRRLRKRAEATLDAGDTLNVVGDLADLFAGAAAVVGRAALRCGGCDGPAVASRRLA